ncbi:MAG: hypothetical protein GC146_12845 [Limimaricola sp.]|uniref:hypothetical protein n=1 Tax=Limimaricola sp. TaxID=2211665 RepID=UPI001D225E0A|nr:hypothetical protein [Limimaricola sp.]MBI1418102.1 hypothetical protein [Limimaricola sp.]
MITRTLTLAACLLAPALAPELATAQTAQPAVTTLLTCTFGNDTVTLVDGGAGKKLQVGGLYYDAAFRPAGSDGGVAAIFTMLDYGPMMIAVENKTQDGSHVAQISAAARTDNGITTKSTMGTCTEGAN